MPQSLKTDVLVIGAGLAGLMAARVLRERGLHVVLLDEGESVGGRLATQRIGAGVADTGAQFFTVRSPEFSAYVERWMADGRVFEWARGWADGSLAVTHDGHPRYAARGGFKALAEHLTEGLEIKTEARVTQITRSSDDWLAHDEQGRTYSARAVLLTPPVPQSLALLEAGGVVLSAADRAALTSIEYAPSLSGVFVLDARVGLPMPGGIQRLGSTISWIADNQRKGISPNALAITVQASPTYSSQLWDLPDERVLAAFRVDIMPFFPSDPPLLEAQLKRWRYALPTVLHPERFLIAADLPLLAFAGDAFGEPRVEGAALSGLAVGRALAERFNR